MGNMDLCIRYTAEDVYSGYTSCYGHHLEDHGDRSVCPVVTILTDDLVVNEPCVLRYSSECNGDFLCFLDSPAKFVYGSWRVVW